MQYIIWEVPCIKMLGLGGFRARSNLKSPCLALPPFKGRDVVALRAKPQKPVLQGQKTKQL